MITEIVKNVLSDNQRDLVFSSSVADKFFQAWENQLVYGNPEIGLPYWSKQEPEFVSTMSKILVDRGFASVKTSKNWSSITFNTMLLDQDDLANFRWGKKLEKYCLRYDLTDQKSSTLVKRPSGISSDGLKRKGMAKTAKTPFSLDVDMLKKYKKSVQRAMLKGIAKQKELGALTDTFFNDFANQENISNELLNFYIIAGSDEEYNLESNTSDQRGRAIKGGLKRIGNPIAYKDFRASIIIPEEHREIVRTSDVEAMNNIYMFIAELNGEKCIGKTIADKIEAGKSLYQSRTLPEAEPEDAHERIWCERIYDELDKLHSSGSIKWSVPIEIDFSMSMGQIVGCLTGDKRLLESTGVIENENNTIEDPWYIPGVPRKLAKVGTAIFYGSSKTPKQLAKGKGFNVKKLNKELKALNREFAKGRFAIMKAFKELLNEGFNITEPVFEVNTGISKFKVEVSRFKPAGSTVVATTAWNGKEYVHSFTRDVQYIPDYKYMKLWATTGLVHHLDSEVMESICKAFAKRTWMIDIHDAVLCSPTIAGSIRSFASNKLKEIYDNRELILKSYMKSINATDNKSIMRLIELQKMIEPVSGKIRWNNYAMK